MAIWVWFRFGSKLVKSKRGDQQAGYWFQDEPAELGQSGMKLNGNLRYNETIARLEMKKIEKKYSHNFSRLTVRVSRDCVVNIFLIRY
ncbi:MAG TPA: hypothetical protein VK588_03670 [Chitinophagaceae bacterium]|nr:hypothetical protein [Chitinophagaceae bacterium]